IDFLLRPGGISLDKAGPREIDSRQEETWGFHDRSFELANRSIHFSLGEQGVPQVVGGEPSFPAQVTERQQLFTDGLISLRIGEGLRSGGRHLGLPGRTILDGMLLEELRLEQLRHRPALHVLPDGETKVGQNGWGEVQDGSLLWRDSAAKTASGGNQDSLLSVPRRGRSIVDPGLSFRPVGLRLETMIRYDQDSRRRIGPGQDCAENLVLTNIESVHS